MEVILEPEIQIELVVYLDKSGSLKELEKASAIYKDYFDCAKSSKTIPAFRFNLVLDFLILTGLAGNFAELLLREVYVARELARKVVWTCIQVINNWYTLPNEMVFCDIRLDGVLPSLPQLTPRFAFTFPQPSTMFVIQGTLLAISKPTKYIQSTIYKCKMTDCALRVKGRRGNEPGLCECGRQEVEVESARISGERVTAYVVHCSAFTPYEFQRHQALKVNFYDDLSFGLELGMRYSIAVSRDPLGLVAWGLSPLVSGSVTKSITKPSPLPKFSEPLNEFITLLQNECKDSPWALVTALASQLASDSYPLEAFLHLKTALLLSLASTGCKTPVPILAIGSDCDCIMRSCIRFSRHAFCPTLTLCTPAAGVVNPQPIDTLAPHLEAGPLLASSQGVCYIGNCPRLNSSAMSQIINAVDSELVRLCPRRTSSADGNVDGQSNVPYQLKTAVWTHWNCNRQSVQDMHRLRTLIDIFGLPFLGDTNDSEEEAIVNHLLTKAMGHEEQLSYLSECHIKEYLEKVSVQHVEMSPLATSLIQDYFVAIRRERPDSLPVRSVKLLTSMCESHARLSLRTSVTYEDAVAVLFLYEESITSLFGPSLISSAPKRIITPSDTISIARQVDTVLSTYSLWLHEYIKSLIGGDSASRNAS